MRSSPFKLETFLYHSETGIPRNLKVRFGKIELRYGQHALHAANTDRYGVIALPSIIDTHLETTKVIEVEATRRGVVVKVLYRIPYCDNFDLVIAVKPYDDGFVKTVWLNAKDDTHTTLDKSKYKRRDE